MQAMTIEDVLKATGGTLLSGDIHQTFNDVISDSRKVTAGVLFVPLVGEKFDGHEFIKAAFDLGASAVLTQRDTELLVDKTIVKVEDTLKAFGDIAKYYKQKYNVPTVSVTGSVGKTTTKDMLASVLSQKYNTLKTMGNFNNEIGLPITIFGLEKEHEAAVLEMGMNHFGEIEHLADIGRPDVAVITNIGQSHIENLGSREGIFKAKMEMTKLFTKDNILVAYTADEEGYGRLPVELRTFKAGLLEGSGKKYAFSFEAGNRNEGYKTASQVNYVARCGSFADKTVNGRSLSYTGALRVLKVIMNYEYLWMNLRVKGGAYGCMSSFGRSGEGYMVSYRDPNMAKTNEIYEGIPDYLRGFSIDERDMTKYVIGTISGMDTPLTPSARGARGLSAYLSGVTEEMMQKERDQVLDADRDDIRALAGQVRAILETGSLCVVGNEEKIEANRGMFGEVSNLTRG